MDTATAKKIETARSNGLNHYAAEYKTSERGRAIVLNVEETDDLESRQRPAYPGPEKRRGLVYRVVNAGKPWATDIHYGPKTVTVKGRYSRGSVETLVGTCRMRRETRWVASSTEGRTWALLEDDEIAVVQRAAGIA